MSDSQNPIRILAVDGDDTRQARYRAAFDGDSGGSYAVLGADGGGKGLSLVQTFRPDCVIVADRLPDLPCAEFISRLARSEADPGPAVVITADPAAEAQALAALDNGADDFMLSDRLTPMQIRRAVGRALALAALRRSVAESRNAAAGLGFEDHLTHLSTRNLFLNRLVHAVILAKRNDQNVGVMLLELSQLKEINFLHGHEAGDAALCETGRRLKTVLREADTVARTSGNQFGIILQTGATYEGSIIAAQKIQQMMAQPFAVEGRTVDLTPDIGIALFPNHGDNGDTLVHHAESAMRQARRQGGGYAMFAYDDMLSDFLEPGSSAA